jgi:hypothetical protein
MRYHQLSQQMLVSALVLFSLAGCGAPRVTPASQAPATSVSNSTGTATPIATTAPQTQTATKTPLVNPQNPFDALYAATFNLQALSVDTIPLVSKPAVKATSLSNPSYIDPVYGTRIYRITAATDFPDAAVRLSTLITRALSQQPAMAIGCSTMPTPFRCCLVLAATVPYVVREVIAR